jgi:hypothetical protein
MSRVPAVIVVSVISSALAVVLASLMIASPSASWASDAPSEPTDGSADQVGAIGSEPVPANVQLVIGSFELRPEVLNLKSAGKYITGFLSLPDGRTVRDVFIPSVMLNGVVYASTSFGPHNTVVEFKNKECLMLKFDKEWVQEILPEGDSVPVWVVGSFVDGTQFVANGEATVVC